MPEKLCIHCHISGRVQGVWFRANTQQEAQKLGLSGWVRNISDGRVEVLACGSKEKINALYKWLQQGPRLAKVKEVTYEELPWQEYSDFEVRG